MQNLNVEPPSGNSLKVPISKFLRETLCPKEIIFWPCRAEGNRISVFSDPVRIDTCHRHIYGNMIERPPGLEWKHGRELFMPARRRSFLGTVQAMAGHLDICFLAPMVYIRKHKSPSRLLERPFNQWYNKGFIYLWRVLFLIEETQRCIETYRQCFMGKTNANELSFRRKNRPSTATYCHL